MTDPLATPISGGTASSNLPHTSVLLAFVLSVILAGANAVAVRFTVDEMDPFWGATLRFAAATAIFEADREGILGK